MTREIRKKKVNDDAVQKALELAKQIKIPVEVLTKESLAADAQELIKAAEVVKELAATEAEGLAMVTTEEAQ